MLLADDFRRTRIIITVIISAGGHLLLTALATRAGNRVTLLANAPLLGGADGTEIIMCGITTTGCAARATTKILHGGLLAINAVSRKKAVGRMKITIIPIITEDLATNTAGTSTEITDPGIGIGIIGIGSVTLEETEIAISAETEIIAEIATSAEIAGSEKGGAVRVLA